MTQTEVGPVIGAEVVAGAVKSALASIDANLIAFGDRYPGDATAGNQYALRAPSGGQPEGANASWAAGFWPGMIWLAYQLTGRQEYRDAGARHVRSFSERLARRVNIDHHDLGFLYTLSCVVPWRLTGDEQARRAALVAADHLLSRVVQPAGVIQAWGGMDDPAEAGRAIIDSLMNLPLLFWASQVTGDTRYAAAARTHAAQLRDHLVRQDSSTYHTFYWDPVTGQPLRGATEQGRADDSCWARGQAWAIYGFSLAFRHTGDSSFLQAAQRCADYFLARLPADHVACWDLVFAEGRGQERDSSAAAIAASGLSELADQLPPGPQREEYRSAAGQILQSLVTGYAPAAHQDSNALLLHGVYDKPTGAGVDEGNAWGDYFYLEALTRAVCPGWVSHW